MRGNGRAVTTTSEKLEYLRVRKIGDCQRCPLHRNRTTVVFGEGNPEADIMFVGEAPGANEDQTGRPFVGRAGKELDTWIEAMGLQRQDVYIANIVKCRPLDNRDPYPQEKETCAPFLHTQIALIQPKVIVALGRHAGNTLSGYRVSMAELRQEELCYDHEPTRMRIPLVAVYHPSYVLRRGRGETQQEALQDLQEALSMAGLPQVQSSQKAPSPQEE